jgi:hypothetical protein
VLFFHLNPGFIIMIILILCLYECKCHISRDEARSGFRCHANERKEIQSTVFLNCNPEVTTYYCRFNLSSFHTFAEKYFLVHQKQIVHLFLINLQAVLQKNCNESISSRNLIVFLGLLTLMMSTVRLYPVFQM